MLKSVAATAAITAVSMLFVNAPSAFARGPADADAAGATSAATRPPAVQKKPIAYGYINTDGSVASGSGNFTSSFDSSNKWYAIKITGKTYLFSNFSTAVTPSFNSSSPAPICGTGSVSGNLLVACYNTAGARVQPPAGLGFIVF